jgi:hypothetical protein
LLTFFGEAKKVSGRRATPGKPVRRENPNFHAKLNAFSPHPKNMKSSLLLCAALLLSATTASAATYEEEVTQYKQFLNDKNYQNPAFESLAWVGISDPQIFDPIEHHLTDPAERAAIENGPHGRDILGHYVRALGFSGQQKYVATLTALSSDSALGRQAKMALEDLPLYQKWNPIISNRATFDPRYSDDVNRVLNMLHSDDFSLKRIGAKRVYFANQDTVLLDTLVTEIQASYMKADISNEDQIAWMVKALGNARQVKYVAFLQQVAQTATDKEVIKYAQRALDSGYGQKPMGSSRN